MKELPGLAAMLTNYYIMRDSAALISLFEVCSFYCVIKQDTSCRSLFDKNTGAKYRYYLWLASVYAIPDLSLQVILQRLQNYQLEAQNKAPGSNQEEKEEIQKMRTCCKIRMKIIKEN